MSGYTKTGPFQAGGAPGIDHNFLNAVEDELVAGPVPVGGIIMYSGDTLDLPSNWQACNGTNGTPDLRDRFIVGAGNDYFEGNTGGANEVTLTEAEMPQHSHFGSVGSGGNHTHGIPYRETADHDHSHDGTSASTARGGTGAGEGWSNTQSNVNTLADGDHTHSVNIGNAGSGEAHENRPPYYALAFIMRLS